MNEATHFSETLVLTRATQCHSPKKKCIFHNHYKNHKSYTNKFVFPHLQFMRHEECITWELNHTQSIHMKTSTLFLLYSYFLSHSLEVTILISILFKHDVPGDSFTCYVPITCSAVFLLREGWTGSLKHYFSLFHLSFIYILFMR
jgi:hypothetical protein